MALTRIDVAAAAGAYPVIIGAGTLATLPRLLDDAGLGPRRVIVSSPVVWGLHGNALRPASTEPQPILIPVYYQAAPLSAPVRQAAYTPLAPTPAPLFYPPTPALDEWPLSRIAATSLPPMRTGSPVVLQSRPIVTPPALDRIQMTSWALLRGQNGRLGPSSLGSGGNL